MNITEAQTRVPKPIDPEKMYKGDSGSRSTFEWQSVGRIRIDLVKRVQPERWRRLTFSKKTKLKSASMWWDLHLKYRKRLV